MGSITPAITLPSSLELLAPDARATPGPSERVQALVFQRASAADLPGQWAGDRYEQTNHLTGMVAVSAKAYTDAVVAGKYRVLERKKPAAMDGTYKKSAGIGHYAQDEEYEPADPDHPLCRLLEEPGGPDGAWTFADELEFLTLQFLLTGDAPAWTPCNADGKPVQFYALTSALTQPTIGAGIDTRWPKGAYRVLPYAGASGFYAGGTLLSGAILPGEEVHRLRERHPWSRNLGMSRLQSGAKEVDVLEAITKSRWSYFERGPMLDCVVSIPGADKDTVAALNGAIRQKHGGADNHGNRILVLGGGLPDGKTSIQSVGQTSQEMTHLQSYDQAAGVVLAFYRVPKSVAGLTAASNYSGLYAEKQQLREYGLVPFFLRLSNYLTGGLAKPWCEFPGQFKIEAEPPPLGDLEMDEKQFSHDVAAGLVTYNQARRKRNLKTVGPEGDVPVSVYLAKLQQPQQPQQLPPGATDGKPDPLAALLGGDQPAAGKVPSPPNPDAEGSRPPRVAKAMSACDDAAGGFLVPPAQVGAAKRRRKRGKAAVASLLKSLEG